MAIMHARAKCQRESKTISKVSGDIVRKKPFKDGASEACLHDIGVSEFGYLPTSKVKFYTEVRDMCKQNKCRLYGTTWACPPGVGTLEECEARLRKFETGMVFSGTYSLRTPFDWKSMMAGREEFNAVSDRLHDLLEGPFLFLSTEGCPRCKKCTYPDAPCRFPEKLHPSIESYGIIVSEVAKEAGVRYNAGDLTITYLGMVCF